MPHTERLPSHTGVKHQTSLADSAPGTGAHLSMYTTHAVCRSAATPCPPPLAATSSPPPSPATATTPPSQLQSAQVRPHGHRSALVLYDGDGVICWR